MRKQIIVWLLTLLLLVNVAYAEGEITSKVTLNETEREIGISQGGDAPATGATAESRLAQMNGKRIGVQTGQSFDKAVAEQLPDAQILYFNSKADTVNALLTGKIDAYVVDEPVIKAQMRQNDRLSYIPEYLESFEFGYVFPKIEKGQALRDQFSEFLRDVRADGTLDEIEAKWFSDDDSQKTVADYSAFPAPNGTLRMATEAMYEPFTYIRNNEIVGYDIDIAVRFCEAYGYGLEIVDMSFDAVLPSVQSGKCDFGGAGITITEERAESVLFSEPNFSGGTVLAVLKGEASANGQAAAAPAWQAYNGKRLGVLIGPLMEDAAAEYFPDSEALIFNSYPDCIAALMSGKIDAYLGDEPSMKMLHAEQPDIDYIHERITQNNYSFAFRKNDPQSAALCEELNEFLSRSWADGTMQELDDIWFGTDEDRKVVDMSDLTGENGRIKVVTTSTDAPFSYIKEGKNVGYDIDLIVRFCRDRGYALELGDVDFAGRIPAIESGKYDFTTDMNVTPEREEQVLFSDPTSYGGIVLAVRSSDIAASSAEDAGGWYHSPQDLAGKRVAVQTGTISGEVTQSVVPDILLDYYNSQTDAMAAVKLGKSDAWATDEPLARFMLIENTDLWIADHMDTSEVAAVFARTDVGQALRDQYSAFVDGLWADGTMEQIDGIWFGTDEDARTVLDYEKLPDDNGTLRMAVDTSIVPFAYVKDNRVVGYDVDIAARFCEANGYRLEVVPMSFDGVLPSVQTGKCDLAACCITVTEERAETVLFSAPNYHSGTVVVLRKADGAATAQEDASQAGGYTSLDQLNGKRIGVQTGTINGPLAEARFPNAQVNYFNSQTDVLTALKTGKVDAWVSDEPIIRFMKADNPELTILDEPLAESNLAAVFPKTEEGQALCDRYSAFIDKLWADGTMEQIDAIWFGTDDAKRTVMDYESLPATNGTLRMAADLSQPPFTYMKDNRVVGYDVDIASRFCQENGYALEIVSMSFDGMLPSVQSGKCDFSDSCITITEERAESVLFSSPNYLGGIVAAVWKEKAPVAAAVTDESEDTSSRDGIISSFHKTFIREGRWRLFADGVLTTLLITLLSILFGTLLGFALFMLCRNGNPVANLVTRFCLWLVQGMPMVVLLMILYYIIFGSVAISGVAVAVIGFTLTFGAAVYGLLKMGVGAVDNGQYEAAYALGYSNRRTFFKIILPQALPHVLPAYRGEIVGLIKATAIVGYIAVQDLTKMGDIVRSRTYEAFFPLIAVTIIYFVLEGLIGFFVSRISVSFNPKRRKPADILKGVKTDD